MAKILLNGSEPTDIKLNGSTPDKIILNGVTYWEKASKMILKRVAYNNLDVKQLSPGAPVLFEDAEENSTVNNFYLDLKKYRFAGSSSSKEWVCSTSIYSYDNETKTVYIIWETQAGSSQQGFDIVEVPDPTRVSVIYDWTTINQGGDIEINLPSTNIVLDDVIVEFRNVHTCESLNKGNWIEVGKNIQNGKLILSFPNYFSATSYLDIRVLCTV